MPEKIFTIPINEAFDRRDGCPLCRLRDALEQQTLEYTLGAAMMEPDVRIEMNRLGFCRAHLEQLFARKNKLALGLILESHLDEVRTSLEQDADGGRRGLFSRRQPGPDAADALGQFSKSCFVCARVRATEARYCSNAAWLWESDAGFRDKLRGQPFFCVTHSGMLLRAARAELRTEDYAALYEALTTLEGAYFSRLRQDVTDFTVSFDHRNAEKPLTEEQRSAIARALLLLR